MDLCPNEMFILSLCTGVGGLELGVKLARPDARVICYVERKDFAVNILKQRIKDGWLCEAPIWDDLQTFDPEPWCGVVDCITAGYPCQGFSSAARGQHTQPDLSGDLIRIVAGCKPKIVFIENVYHARRSLARLRRQLAEMGYRSPPLLDLRASDVGSPHKRRRLFLAAYANSYSKPRLPEYAEMARLQVANESVWEDHTGALRVAHGLSTRMDRLDASGNGVVPLVAAYAWRILEDLRLHCERG